MSSKQKVVACSNIKAEYRALALAAYEVVWLTSILKELQLVPAHKPILFTESLNAKYLTANSVIHACMKHVEIDFHFIRDLVETEQLDVRFTPSHDQIANALTKPLGETRSC